MADLPIPFTAPMVRALLREIEAPGTGKTQTRRTLNVKAARHTLNPRLEEPRYRVGDRLYVREHWRTSDVYDDLAPSQMGGEEPVIYLADDAMETWGWGNRFVPGRFRQGMHMPRWASRITLLVTEVRVERLHDCSEADAIAEGITMILEDGPLDAWFSGTRTTCDFTDQDMHGWHHNDARAAYADLWDQINGPGAWAANPWVAAYTFRPVLGNIDQIGEAR